MTRVMIKHRATGNIIADGVLGETVLELESGWYFAQDAVDTSHLRVTDRIYTCPYKGDCNWIDLETPEIHAQSTAWVYDSPKRGYEYIAGLIAFDRRGSLATEAVIAEMA